MSSGDDRYRQEMERPQEEESQLRELCYDLNSTCKHFLTYNEVDPCCFVAYDGYAGEGVANSLPLGIFNK